MEEVLKRFYPDRDGYCIWVRRLGSEFGLSGGARDLLLGLGKDQRLSLLACEHDFRKQLGVIPKWTGRSGFVEEYAQYLSIKDQQQKRKDKYLSDAVRTVSQELGGSPASGGGSQG